MMNFQKLLSKGILPLEMKKDVISFFKAIPARDTRKSMGNKIAICRQYVTSILSKGNILEYCLNESYSLLSKGENSRKIGKKGKELSIKAYYLALAPNSQAFSNNETFSLFGKSHKTLCKFASNDCKQACNGHSGNYANTSLIIATMIKTRFLLLFPELFSNKLIKELESLNDIVYASKYKNILLAEQGKELGIIPTIAIRLNAYSDIDFFKLLPELKQFKDFTFYGYTKDIHKAIRNGKEYLTFSYSGNNEKNCRLAYRKGLNVAIPVASKDKLYQTVLNQFDTVDGDEHDYRFLDKENSVVVLKEKVGMKKDKNTDKFIIKSIDEFNRLYNFITR